MKKIEIKYLWIYTIVLFSVALALIIFSSVNQQRSQQNADYFEAELTAQRVFAEGVQKTLSNITEENEYLKEQLKKEREERAAEIEELKNGFEQETIKQKAETAAAIKKEQSANALILAHTRLEARKYKEAREVLMTVDPSLLKEEGQALYNKIDAALLKKKY